jgi:hypothetical protein
MGNFSTNSFPSNRFTDSDTLATLDSAIQSIDAAIRHAFGFSVNTLTAPFDIADDGSIVVQTSIAIGTSNAMIDVVDSIPASAGANEDQKLAHVDAIRSFLDVERLPGANIDLNTGNFDGHLSGADDTAQKAFDTLDDLDLSTVLHYDVPNEWVGTITETNFDTADYILIEDQSDGGAKKIVPMQSFIDYLVPATHDHDDDYVNVTGDTMTGSLVIEGGDLDFDNSKTMRIKDTGGTKRNILSVTDADLVSIGDVFLDVAIRGLSTRPQYDDNIGGFEDLALYSDIEDLSPLRSEWLQNGFPDRAEVDMDWDDASETLTIQPSNGSFRYFHDGILYTETGSLTDTLPGGGAGTDEGLWIFYIDGEGSMTSILDPSNAQLENAILNECLVAYVYWDDTNEDGRLMSELHGSGMSPATHHYLHDIRGTQYYNGLTVADIDADLNL